MQGTGSIPSRTERKIRTCLLCCLGWLPPRMGGAVYSFAFLMGGLLWVSGRALIDFYQFLRGQIPPRQLWWSVVDDPNFLYEVPPLMERRPVLEDLRHVLRRHGVDLQKSILGYPRNADLKEEVKLLKRLGDAFGEKMGWSMLLPQDDVHSEARRVIQCYFAEPRFDPICLRERAKALNRGTVDSLELAKEHKCLCKALWDEVNDMPPESSASDAVLENLAKLMQLVWKKSGVANFIGEPQSNKGSEALVPGAIVAALPESGLGARDFYEEMMAMAACTLQQAQS